MKIEKKIVSYAVKDESKKIETASRPQLIERGDILNGKTYKIRPGGSDHALYITINDRNGAPYEIFANSKCPASMAWLMTVTRLLSAVMRVSDDIQFAIDELKNVQDPQGGYFYKGLGHMPSVQAHIGHILERHIGTKKEVAPIVVAKQSPNHPNN